MINKNITVKKGLSLTMLIALVIGNMIGSGIFLLPASLAAFGTISIFAWILTAIGSLFLAFLFADLSKRFPRTGGPYVYSREGFGDFTGFLVAYNYWIALWIGNAAVAVALAGYVGVFWPAINDHMAGVYNPFLAFAVKAGAVWFFTAINIFGVRSAGNVQVLTTALKILPLFLIIIFGIFHINPQNLAHFNINGQSNAMALSSAATLTLWAFIGLESATVPADEANDPRDISRATIYGTIVTTLIYILSTAVIMGLIPPEILQHSQAPYADAATILFGQKMQWIIAATAILSCLGALNGWILLQGQVPMAAARDGLFPVVFANRCRFGTPAKGLAISGCLITGLLLLTIDKSFVSQFTFVTLLATLAFLIPYFFSAMADLMIFVKEPSSIKLLRKPLFIAIAAGIYSFWTIAGSGLEVVFYGMLLFLTGIPVYIWLKWRMNP